ncbi:MAG: phosphate ABC transporter substrate-binding protein [Rhodobacteraceae bacterium]|nr:MAG: phosphate ABC transporter substrate-binding protein [Paracoccaceae bacterium]
MSGRACLPMYDWPETRGAVDAFYARMRAKVPELPAKLTRPETEDDLKALWRDPALLLGQTCWGPLGAGLRNRVTILGQPLYDDVPGGQGAQYRSAVVMRAGRACPPPEAPGACLPDGLDTLRPAINATDSLSGAIALSEDMGSTSAASLVTGSHRASIRAVAEGRADYAAIDCRSWALAQAYESAARELVVTGWTALRPGLPFITAKATAPALRRRVARALAELGAIAPLEEIV